MQRLLQLIQPWALSIGHDVDVAETASGFSLFDFDDLLDDLLYGWVTALGVGVVDFLRGITLLRSGWRVKVIDELWELIESGPSRPPFSQPAAMLLKVTSADVERKEARDDRIWVFGGTSCEPVGGKKLLIFVKSVDYERRPPELGNHWGFKEKGDDIKKTLGAKDPGSTFRVNSREL